VVSLQENYLGEEGRQYNGEQNCFGRPEEMFRHISHMLIVYVVIGTSSKDDEIGAESGV
jgi:hypothetical protein